jgi:hypothetical protein
LFVVVVAVAIGLGLWVRHEQHLVNERHAIIERLDPRQFAHVTYASEIDGSPSWQLITPLRRALGDQPVQRVELPYGATDADCERARFLFPEASKVGGAMF